VNQCSDVFFKSVNNSQSYKSSAQLCHQELVEQMQLFKLLCFKQGYLRDGKKYYVCK